MGLSEGWKGVAQATGLALLIPVVIAGVAFAIQGPRAFEWGASAPSPTPAEAAASALSEKVRRGPITEAQHRKMEEALVNRFPQGSRVADGNVTFYFDAGATGCGMISPRGQAPRRYIYRNDFVMVEGDLSASDFAMFWQICEAGGA